MKADKSAALWRTVLVASSLLMLMVSASLTVGSTGTLENPSIEEAKAALVSIWPSGECQGVGTGTGFFITPQGHILTAAHVVGDFEIGGTVTVQWAPPGREPQLLTAIILAKKPEWDTALLQVQGEGEFPWLRLGNSDQVQGGDSVAILGFPEPESLGCITPTLTTGQVTARKPPGELGESYQAEALQISVAPIRPGSSGSPVFNEAGEVIGILFAGTGIPGLGTELPFYFAVPINVAKECLCEWEELDFIPPEVRQFLEQPTLLYEDDFGNPMSGWVIWPPPPWLPIQPPAALLERLDWAEVWYEDGKYSIKVGVPYKYFPAVPLNLDIPLTQVLILLFQVLECWCGDASALVSPEVFRSDFRVVVEARRVSGPIGSYGIIFRLKGDWDDNFYTFTISSDGSYSLFKYVNRRWVEIVPWTYSTHIRQGTEWNLLEVEAIGPEISLFVNRKHLTTVKDSTFLQGFIGLTVQSFDEPGIKVEFDNFKILSAERICK